MFGNGIRGARPPSGIENIKAIYRTGIGTPGNVAAQQISQLTTRPLGVKSVMNPLPGSGGADRESRDQARRNAPVGTRALDRLISLQDYADFTRTFAGVGKASVRQLSTGREQVIHLTIAGADDIPIDPTSDLYRNLTSALSKFGDARQAIQVDLRERLLIVISANVRLLPDYLWEVMAPKIRAALLDAFSFETRDLGQDVFLSEVLSVMQGIEGVLYVDVDTFGTVGEAFMERDLERIVKRLSPLSQIPVQLAQTHPKKDITPAQIAFLSPKVRDTLILQLIN